MFASSLYSWTCSWRCQASAGAHRSTSAWEKLKSQVNVRCVDIASFEASMHVGHHQLWRLQGTFLFNSSTKKNTKGQSGRTNDGDLWIFCSQHTWHHSFKVEMLSAHGSEGNFQRLELQVLEFPFGPQAPIIGEGIDDYADLFLVFSSATILHLEIFQLRSRTGPKKFAVSQVI